jgi:hypothetical protein
MSRVDDVIRRELRRSNVEVDGGAAFERVDRRHRHLRAVRRFRVVVLAVLLTVGTIGAGVGLVSLLEHRGRSRIGGNPSPLMEPSLQPGAEPSALCGASSMVADLDGDGADDRIEVGVPVPGPEVSCDQVELQGYVARIELATGTDRARPFEQRLPECDIEALCWLLATPDLGDDGTDEAAIVVSTGASTITFALYRFEAATPDEPLQRLQIAEPGDPWHEEFGFPPGPATFSWYGSVTHRHWLSCDEDPEHRLAAITVLRAYDDPKDRRVEDVHGVLFALDGSMLVVAFTWDEQVPEATLDAPPDMCGSPMNPRPSP